MVSGILHLLQSPRGILSHSGVLVQIFVVAGQFQVNISAANAITRQGHDNLDLEDNWKSQYTIGG